MCQARSQNGDVGTAVEFGSSPSMSRRTRKAIVRTTTLATVKQVILPHGNFADAGS